MAQNPDESISYEASLDTGRSCIKTQDDTEGSKTPQEASRGEIPQFLRHFKALFSPFSEVIQIVDSVRTTNAQVMEQQEETSNGREASSAPSRLR